MEVALYETHPLDYKKKKDPPRKKVGKDKTNNTKTSNTQKRCIYKIKWRSTTGQQWSTATYIFLRYHVEIVWERATLAWTAEQCDKQRTLQWLIDVATVTKRNRQERLRSDEGRDRGAKVPRALKRPGC